MRSLSRSARSSSLFLSCLLGPGIPASSPPVGVASERSGKGVERGEGLLQEARASLASTNLLLFSLLSASFSAILFATS